MGNYNDDGTAKHECSNCGPDGCIQALEAEVAKLQSRVARFEAGPEFSDVPPLEDGDTLSGRDLLEVIDNAKRLKGDRVDGPGGPPTIKLEPYEVVVSRSEYVAMVNTVQADRVARGKADTENRRLREALEKLKAEANAITAFRCEIVEVIGNTNWRCLRNRVEEAEKALAGGGA